MEDFRGPPFHITHHGWVGFVNGSGPSKETGLVLPPGQNFFLLLQYALLASGVPIHRDGRTRKGELQNIKR